MAEANYDLWGEYIVSDSELVFECERAERKYLDEQQRELEWGSISDGHLVDCVLGVETEMERKRIADLQSEAQAVKRQKLDSSATSSQAQPVEDGRCIFFVNSPAPDTNSILPLENSDMNADYFVGPHKPSALEQIMSYGDITDDDDIPLDMEPHLSDDETHYQSNDDNPSAMDDHVSHGSAFDPTPPVAEAQVSPVGTTFSSLPSTSQPLTHQIGNQVTDCNRLAFGAKLLRGDDL